MCILNAAPGYNAAYWNIHERNFSYRENTHWVNETTRLYFFITVAMILKNRMFYQNIRTVSSFLNVEIWKPFLNYTRIHSLITGMPITGNSHVPILNRPGC